MPPRWRPLTKRAGNSPLHSANQRLPRTRLHSLRRAVDGWSLSTSFLACLILAPLVLVLAGVFHAGPRWGHIVETVLGGYVGNTVLLVVLVSTLALAFAILPAWLVAAFDFPGRKLFEWALVLPLALPTYVAAFVFYPLLDEAIPFLVQIRSAFGIEAFQWAERILRYGLLSIVMAAVLFPYVYISARGSFSQQRRAAIESARLLGRGPVSVFTSVALPLARPAIVAGVSLVVMEVVNDYGAVHFFGVPTVTEGIFRTWFGLADKESAIRIAGLVMLAVLLLLTFERVQRGGRRFAGNGLEPTLLSRARLSGLKAWWATLVCLLPLAIGFLYPVGRLLIWASWTAGDVLEPTFLKRLGASLGLSILTAAILTAVAVLFVYATKLQPSVWRRVVNRLSTVGYAAPGAVIALGVMAATGRLDQLPGVAVSGSLLAIAFAYLVRFLAVAHHPVRAGMDRVCGTLDEASRVLGRSPLATLFLVNLPLVRGTLVAATMLVFVDILKELPLTLILRPANFETLATTSFSLAKEGRIHECSVPSLLIVVVGALGLLALNRTLRTSRV